MKKYFYILFGLLCSLTSAVYAGDFNAWRPQKSKKMSNKQYQQMITQWQNNIKNKAIIYQQKNGFFPAITISFLDPQWHTLFAHLMDAVKRNELERVQRLLTDKNSHTKSSAKPLLNVLENEYPNYTPLHYAVEAADKEMAQLLLKFGADADATGYLNDTDGTRTIVDSPRDFAHHSVTNEKNLDKKRVMFELCDLLDKYHMQKPLAILIKIIQKQDLAQLQKLLETDYRNHLNDRAYWEDCNTLLHYTLDLEGKTPKASRKILTMIDLLLINGANPDQPNAANVSARQEAWDLIETGKVKFASKALLLDRFSQEARKEREAEIQKCNIPVTILKKSPKNTKPQCKLENLPTMSTITEGEEDPETPTLSPTSPSTDQPMSPLALESPQ